MGVVRMYRCGYNNYYFALLHLYYLFFCHSIAISLFIFLMCFRSLYKIINIAKIRLIQ